MTALALALVACCAMLCGTRLLLRGYDVREVEAEASIRDSNGLRAEVATLRADADALMAAHQKTRQELESLRADLAVRSLG